MLEIPTQPVRILHLLSVPVSNSNVSLLECAGTVIQFAQGWISFTKTSMISNILSSFISYLNFSVHFNFIYLYRLDLVSYDK